MNTNHSRFSMGFFTGDFILKATEQQWDEIDAVVKNWTPEMHYIAGNHDVGDRTLFRQRHNETNRSFVKDNNLYVIWDLNSTGWHITKEQWQMITDALAVNGNIHNIFVFTHQLFFNYGSGPLKEVQPNSLDGKAPDLHFFEDYLASILALESDIYFFCGDVGAHKYNSDPGGFKYRNLHILYSGMGAGVNDNFICASVLGDSVQLSVKYLDPFRQQTIDDSFYVNLEPE